MKALALLLPWLLLGACFLLGTVLAMLGGDPELVSTTPKTED